MHAAFHKGVSLSPSSEEVSVNTMMNISSLWGNAVQYDDIFNLIQDVENRKGNRTVFDSILKITYFARVPNKKLEDVRWVFRSLADQCLAGIANNSSYSMNDVGQKGNVVTIQQILCQKKLIKEYCEGPFPTNEFVPRFSHRAFSLP